MSILFRRRATPPLPLPRTVHRAAAAYAFLAWAAIPLSVAGQQDVGRPIRVHTATHLGEGGPGTTVPEAVGRFVRRSGDTLWIDTTGLGGTQAFLLGPSSFYTWLRAPLGSLVAPDDSVRWSVDALEGEGRVLSVTGDSVHVFSWQPPAPSDGSAWRWAGVQVLRRRSTRGRTSLALAGAGALVGLILTSGDAGGGDGLSGAGVVFCGAIGAIMGAVIDRSRSGEPGWEPVEGGAAVWPHGPEAAVGWAESPPTGTAGRGPSRSP